LLADFLVQTSFCGKEALQVKISVEKPGKMLKLATFGLVPVGATTGSYIAIEKTRPQPSSQIAKGDLGRRLRASRECFSW